MERIFSCGPISLNREVNAVRASKPQHKFCNTNGLKNVHTSSISNKGHFSINISKVAFCSSEVLGQYYTRDVSKQSPSSNRIFMTDFHCLLCEINSIKD
ncbi:hypothetical protein CEXT_159671 [Caerostris extrusa]|uniref:Uncharacterized protein n=1 Tax=Caerostris extrusa TaxID=172846 RepID=A0AAV4Y8G9_CAEEX|nr:hypothetical protein CEXT_159671 [Caerostris extrusa]